MTSHDRYASKERHPLSVPKGPKRKLKHLSVTVSVAGNAFAQGPELYRCVVPCVCMCVHFKMSFLFNKAVDSLLV